MIMGVETSTEGGPMETFCKLFGSLLALHTTVSIA